VSLAVVAGITSAIDGDTLPWFTWMDRPGPIHIAWRILVTGGQFALVAALSILMAAGRSWQQRSIRTVLVTAVTVIGLDFVLWVFKEITGRTSPHSNLNLVLSGGSSYPSGHTANATASLLLIARLSTRDNPRARLIAAAALSFGVGIANIVLGYHWASDVLGGWLLGLIALALPARFLGQKR
jgi:membrane-associated phospholipid phosphatase